MRGTVTSRIAVVVLIAAAFSSACTVSLAALPDAARKGIFVLDFENETVGAPPKSIVPVVGRWEIVLDGDNKVLLVDGTEWKQGEPATDVAERAKALYGDKYAEFLDNVKAFAFFPYSVAEGVADFDRGEISFRFKTIAGKIDQGAGILFNLQPSGDYLALRANPLENNLVLWKFEKGVRTSVKWVKDVPTSSNEWHTLRLVVDGLSVAGYLDDKLLLTHQLAKPVSGRVGLWSKADSVIYFDDYTIKSGK